jgi:hypothetical protein
MEIEGVLVLPKDYEKGTKIPLIVQIHGGSNLQWANDISGEVMEASKALDQKFIAVERKLFILRTTGASENLLRFPQQLYSHLKMLGYHVMTGDARPTQSKYEVFEELSRRLKQYQDD